MQGDVLMKTNKEIVYFDNYNFEAYEKAAAEQLEDMGFGNYTDEQIWNVASKFEQGDWDEFNYIINKFIESGKSFIAVGTCGRWDGNYAGGLIFGHWDDFKRRVFEDCDYFKIWEEHGHLYVRCSHHDRTHSLEIKELTDKGFEYYENWQFSNDTRTEREVHHKLLTDSHYSHLPRLWHKVYEREVA